MDVCFRDVITNPLKLKIPLFPICVVSNIAYMFYQGLTSSKRYLKSLLLSNIFGTYVFGSFVVLLLKNALMDSRCNVHPNSVSGHAFFNYYFFMSWFVTMKDFRRKSLIHRSLFIIVELLLSSSFMLTYFGGYHTPRQILYGTLVAILFLLYLVFIVKRLRPYLSFGINVIGTLTVMLVGFNGNGLKPGFNAYVVPFISWAIISLFVMWRYNTKKMK